jgi:hypothetical protein
MQNILRVTKCIDKGQALSCHISNRNWEYTWQLSFRFQHHAVITRSEILDKRSASIFRVTELVQVDAEVMQCKKMGLLYRMVWGCLVNHSHTTQEGGNKTALSRWKRIPKNGPFYNMDAHIKMVYPWPLPTGHSTFTAPTGWDPEKIHFWNSQLPLLTTILSTHSTFCTIIAQIPSNHPL